MNGRLPARKIGPWLPELAILFFVPVILIGGGSRSGKSRYAVERALALSPTAAFLATAEALDEEMAERIRRHREERADRFLTVEAPVAVAEALRETAAIRDVIVLDCLTLWLSNVLHHDEPNLAARVDALVGALRDCPATVFVVTNEVGCGIVPENALARRFRDEAGFLNARCAEIAAEVYWMVFGCPLRVK